MDLSAEAATLATANRLSIPARVRSIPLLKYDPILNVLVTEHVDGDPLFNVLWNSTALPTVVLRRQRDYAALMADLAAWLGAFHAIGPGSSDAYDASLGWLRESFESKAGAIESSQPPAVHLLARVRVRFHALLEHDSWRVEPIVRVHGDFCPANVLVDRSGGAMVLDFADTREGFALEDVVRMWSSIWEMAVCGRLRQARLAPALDAFARGVARAQALEIESAPFKALRIWNGVTRMLQAAAPAPQLSTGTRLLLRRLNRVNERWLQVECR